MNDQLTMFAIENPYKFVGSNYEPAFDEARLGGQIRRIYDYMIGGGWHTLSEIARATGAGAASVSAQLRNLRKPGFGSHTVNKRPRGERGGGLWEYQVLTNGE